MSPEYMELPVAKFIARKYELYPLDEVLHVYPL